MHAGSSGDTATRPGNSNRPKNCVVRQRGERVEQRASLGRVHFLAVPPHELLPATRVVVRDGRERLLQQCLARREVRQPDVVEIASRESALGTPRGGRRTVPMRSPPPTAVHCRVARCARSPPVSRATDRPAAYALKPIQAPSHANGAHSDAFWRSGPSRRRTRPARWGASLRQTSLPVPTQCRIDGLHHGREEQRQSKARFRGVEVVAAGDACPAARVLQGLRLLTADAPRRLPLGDCDRPGACRASTGISTIGGRARVARTNTRKSGRARGT